MRTIVRKPIFTYLKWLISAVSLAFVSYKLYSFNQLYEQQSVDIENTYLLIFALALMPVNWLIESYKWQLLLKPVFRTKLFNSVKSVLSGVSAGVLTPNRLGEPFGRLLYIPPRWHTAVLGLAVAGSALQSGTTFIFGLAAMALLPSMQYEFATFSQVYIALVMALILALLVLVYFCRKQLRIYFRKEILHLQVFVRNYPLSPLLYAGLLSVLRYLVFSIQQYSVFMAFGFTGSFTEMGLRIFAFYFIISYLPVVPLVGFGLRASIIIILFGSYSQNAAILVLVAAIPWAINVALPAMVGAWFVAKAKSLTYLA